jgi:structural maintenance of chromosome 2
MTKGGKVQALTDAVNALERGLVKTKTQLEIKEGSVGEDRKRVDTAKTAVKEVSEMQTNLESNRLRPPQLEKALERKRDSTSKDTVAFSELKMAYDTGVAELAKTEELLQTLITGLSSSDADDENAGGYMGQLAEAKARLAAAGTEAEQANLKIGLAEKEVKEKEPRAKRAEKEGEGSLKELVSKRAHLEKLRKRAEGAGWDEKKERDLLQRQDTHSAVMTELIEVTPT